MLQVLVVLLLWIRSFRSVSSGSLWHRMVLLVLVRMRIRSLEDLSLIFIRIDPLSLFHQEVRVTKQDELIALTVGVLYYLNTVLSGA